MVASRQPTKWPPSSLETPVNAPHAGSHYAARRPRPPFFEGWYLRVTLPSSASSFAFMFSIEAPDHGTMQLLTPSDNLHTRTLPTGRFTADKARLSVSHWGYPDADPRIRLSRSDNALQGYQLGATGSHGRFRGEKGLVQWGIDYRPLLTWGTRGTTRHTATWLSQLQLFEPGYQVLMAHGVVTDGYIISEGVRVDVTDAVVYCEKNWGRSFPSRWWWVQANGFWDVRDLSVLAVGARRRVLTGVETVGMIAIHYNGEMYEFANWSCESLRWEVGKWGSWKAWSVAWTGHVVEIVAHTEEKPVGVLGPSENGMVFNVQDCARGLLSVTLRDEKGDLVLDNVCCDNAQVEVGGEWTEEWEASVSPMPCILRAIVNRFNGPRVRTSP